VCRGGCREARRVSAEVAQEPTCGQGAEHERRCEHCHLARPVVPRALHHDEEEAERHDGDQQAGSPSRRDRRSAAALSGVQWLPSSATEALGSPDETRTAAAASLQAGSLTSRQWSESRWSRAHRAEAPDGRPHGTNCPRTDVVLEARVRAVHEPNLELARAPDFPQELDLYSGRAIPRFSRYA
jgi:hypothetical protein